jgi:hypothetical protein
MELEALKEFVVGHTFNEIATDHSEVADQMRSLFLPSHSGFTDEQRQLISEYLLSVPEHRLLEIENLLNELIEPADPEIEGSENVYRRRAIAFSARESIDGNHYLDAGLLTDVIAGKPLEYAGDFLRSLVFVNKADVAFPSLELID